ncbi:MAG: L,D-transpeptidase [Coriobacteriia bacterium]|nr:L,D-transpeptidase [Coriobacteriia bacterium]
MRTHRILSAALFVLALLVGLLPIAATASVALPAPPTVISPAQNALVPSTFTMTGRLESGVTEIRVTGATSVTSTIAADSAGATYTAEVTVPYGKRSIGVEAGNGAGWSTVTSVTVYNLGATPSFGRYVLVDKSDFRLYVVRSGQVTAAYPIAIGMHTRYTETPVGTFYLNRPGKAPNSAWGPFRMNLAKRIRTRVYYTVHVRGHHVRRSKIVVRMRATYYYIHGTNDRNSIGFPASHGCIRMYNEDLRALSPRTARWEPTVIRN